MFYKLLFILLSVFIFNACNSSGGDGDSGDVLTFLSSATITIDENSTEVFNIEAVVGEQPISYAVDGGVDQALFEIDVDSGALRFMEVPNFESPMDDNNDNVYEIIIKASGDSVSGQQTLVITVADVDESPFFTSMSEFSVPENNKDLESITADDPEKQSIGYEIEDDLDGGLFTINTNTSVLSFNNAPDFEAPQDHNSDNIYELFIIASDGTNQTRLKFVVTVSGVNEFPPKFPQVQLNVPENSLFDQTVGADDDGDELTYEIIGGDDQSLFMIDSSTGALRFKEGPDYESPSDANADNQYQVTVRVSDGENSHTETLTFTVDPVNEAPVFTSTTTIEITENNQITLTVAATDPEGDDVEFALIGGADAALFDFNVSTRELRFKTIPDFELPTDSGSNNQYLVIVSASDQSLISEQQIYITVTGENDNAAVFTTADTLNYFENNTAAIKISANDIDGDTLQYSIVDSDPDLDETKFSINSDTGELSFNNSPDFETPGDSDSDNIYQVEIRVFDGIFSTTKTIAIHVKDDPEQLDVVSGGIKTLRFSWPAIPEASHYRLFQNSDGVSGFEAATENIANGVGTIEFDFEIPVHLTNWVSTTFLVEAYDNSERLTESPQVGVASLMLDSIGYVKAASPDVLDWFGYDVAVSGDGNTVAVGVPRDDSNSSSDPANNDLEDSGAVYVFVKSTAGWEQQAYLKALSFDEGDQFGTSVSLSDDGNVLAIGASGEDSAAVGVNEDASDNSLNSSGAAYIFERIDEIWQQTNYIKASNSGKFDSFGRVVSLSRDGQTLAVSAIGEQSNATSINGNQEDNSLDQSGAVYVYSKTSNVWQQQAYIKASNADDLDRFGQVVSLSGDGNTLLITTYWEDSKFGDENDNSLEKAGAAYVFTRTGNTWAQHSFIKSPAPDAGDWFGYSAALSKDGQTLSIGAIHEKSASTGINGNPENNEAPLTPGAVYLFKFIGNTWEFNTYFKSDVIDTTADFGSDLALSSDGSVLVISDRRDARHRIGVDDQTTTLLSGTNSGGAYVFTLNNGEWDQSHYIKAINTDKHDNFGTSVGMSDDGGSLVISAIDEQSNGTGFTADPENNDIVNGAGAIYIY